MKVMTCKQLGGACDTEFRADTFQEMANLIRDHGIEMMRKGDKAHMEAMDKMRELMQTPESMQQWMEAKRKEFEALPDQV